MTDEPAGTEKSAGTGEPARRARPAAKTAAKAAGKAAAKAAAKAAGEARGNAAAKTAGKTAGKAPGNAAAKAPGKTAAEAPGNAAGEARPATKAASARKAGSARKTASSGLAATDSAPSSTTAADSTPTAPSAPSAPSAPRIGRGPLVAAALSLAWFVTTLVLTHASVVGEREAQLGLVNAALAMPLLIASGIVAGAALAVVVLKRFERLQVPRWRVLYGAGVGLLLGAAAGAAVLLGYGTAAALVSLAISMAVAAAIGGALGGVPWPAVVVAGVIGSLVRFALGFFEGLFGGRLREAIAGDEGVPAQLAAVGQIGFAMALVGGAVAGLTASLYLRKSGLKWPAHLAAGAAPGLLLLIADIATRVGGTPLLRAMSGNDTFDERALQLVASTRLSTAMVVLFTGAVVAIVVHGRTLGPATPAPDQVRKGRTTPARGPQRRRR